MILISFVVVELYQCSYKITRTFVTQYIRLWRYVCGPSRHELEVYRIYYLKVNTHLLSPAAKQYPYTQLLAINQPAYPVPQRLPISKSLDIYPHCPSKQSLRNPQPSAQEL